MLKRNIHLHALRSKFPIMLFFKGETVSSTSKKYKNIKRFPGCCLVGEIDTEILV